jgi:hypothetical protein
MPLPSVRHIERVLPPYFIEKLMRGGAARFKLPQKPKKIVGLNGYAVGESMITRRSN